MADEAIALDAAPEVDAAPIEAGPDASAPDSGAPPDASADSPDGQPEPDKAEAPKTYEPAIVDGRLSKSAYQAISEIKKTNPRFAAEIKAALFDAHNLRSALPGGLKEVEELRGQLNELGGLPAIQQTREELQYFNDLDQQFTAGDPRFVQAMLDTPEGQQGFLKLAPSMMDKYREMAPDHHDVYVAKQEFQNLGAADVKLTLLRLQDVISEVEGVKPELAAKLLQQWQPLAQYYNSVAERAAKKADIPQIAKPAAGGDDRERELSTREENLVKSDWRSAGNAERMKIFNSEWAKQTKDLRLTDSQSAAVKELYASRLGKALAKVPNFNENAQRYFATRDKDGFVRHTASTLRTLIPQQLRAAIDAVVTNKGVARPAAPAAPGAPPAAAPRVGKPADGFTWVTGPPDKAKIAFGPGRTTGEMIRAGKAILEDGKRVQWRTA